MPRCVEPGAAKCSAELLEAAKNGEVQPESTTSCQKQPGSSQEHPGEQPEVVRRSVGAGRMSHEQQGTAKSSRNARAGRSSQEQQPGTIWSRQVEPEGSQEHPMRSQVLPWGKQE